MTQLSRRTLLIGTAVGTLAGSAIQKSQGAVRLNGRIAFVDDGKIQQWSNDGIATLKEDANAMSLSWQPFSDTLMYVRNGGSYSNLIELDTSTGRTKRLTSSESQLQEGSAIYVADSVWILDPSWSESGIVVFASSAGDAGNQMYLWILRYDAEVMLPSPTDGSILGNIEKPSVDAAGRYACFTVTGEDQMSAFLAVRDLDTGANWAVLEGSHGAYDGALTPNGRWIVGTVRDSDGKNDLWITDVDALQATRLTNGEEASNAVWDPWGEWVAYTAFTGRGFGIRAFRVDFSGSAPAVSGDIEVIVEDNRLANASRLSWGT